MSNIPFGFTQRDRLLDHADGDVRHHPNRF